MVIFDTDGCPDRIPISTLSDADFDGIIDSLDVCKYEQENLQSIPRY